MADRRATPGMPPIQCRASRCQKLSQNPPPESIFRSRYCLDHHCHATYCGEQRTKNSLFCTIHKCQWTNCNDSTTQSFAQFCIRHECHYSKCKLPRIAADTWFCIHHECVYANCQACGHKKDIGGQGHYSACCPRHTCREGGCLQMAVLAVNGFRPAFCSAHGPRR